MAVLQAEPATAVLVVLVVALLISAQVVQRWPTAS
jgi:hypothetical protein